MKAETKKVLRLATKAIRKEIEAEKKAAAAGSASASKAMTETEKALVRKINEMDDALGEDVDFVTAVQDVLFCAAVSDVQLKDNTIAVFTSETMSRMTKIRDKIHEMAAFATGNLTGKEEAA